MHVYCLYFEEFFSGEIKGDGKQAPKRMVYAKCIYSGVFSATKNQDMWQTHVREKWSMLKCIYSQVFSEKREMINRHER